MDDMFVGSVPSMHSITLCVLSSLLVLFPYNYAFQFVYRARNGGVGQRRLRLHRSHAARLRPDAQLQAQVVQKVAVCC